MLLQQAHPSQWRDARASRPQRPYSLSGYGLDMGLLHKRHKAPKRQKTRLLAAQSGRHRARRDLPLCVADVANRQCVQPC